MIVRFPGFPGTCEAGSGANAQGIIHAKGLLLPKAQFQFRSRPRHIRVDSMIPRARCMPSGLFHLKDLTGGRGGHRRTLLFGSLIVWLLIELCCGSAAAGRTSIKDLEGTWISEDSLQGGWGSGLSISHLLLCVCRLDRPADGRVANSQSISHFLQR